MSQSPDANLRHITSNPALGVPVASPSTTTTTTTREHRERDRDRRTSQHLRTIDPRVGVGSLSPSSIPSSPTSIHSSSSAIFERDIEPIIPPSPPGSHHITHPAHATNPHRIPRAKGTEALENSVPSVLDSAAAALSSLEPAEAGDLDIVAPVVIRSAGAGAGSGFASPIGSFRSRSPSPSPGTGIESRIASPTSVLGLHNVPGPVPAVTDDTLLSLSPNLSPSTSSTSHPPSPLHLPKKRLSFMSYADLLSSTPSSTQPLANLTLGANTAEPPPHIPGVSGLNVVSALWAQGVDVPVPPAEGAVAGKSATPSLRSISMGLSLPLNAIGGPLPLPVSSPPPPVLLGPQGGVTHPHKRDSIAMLDNIGGEWEREGLGRGLEERLVLVDATSSASAEGVGVIPETEKAPAVVDSNSEGTRKVEERGSGAGKSEANTLKD